MNCSLYSADRTTHLKIVALALLAATAVAGIGIAAQFHADRAQAEQVLILKAGKPVMATTPSAGRA